MSSKAFTSLMGSANSAVVVVTTVADDVRAGCLVGYHSQSSISPQQYCFWLSKANHTYRAGLLATHFAVHFLTDDDLALAQHFATRSGDDTDKFVDLDVEPHEHGVPLLKDCPNRVVLERLSIVDDGGDHVCVTARVVDAESSGKFTPLRIADLGKVTPAHGSDERAVHS